MAKIFRDKDGKVVNIGDWDYLKHMVHVGEKPALDEAGKPKFYDPVRAERVVLDDSGKPMFEEFFDKEGHLIRKEPIMETVEGDPIPIMEAIQEEREGNPMPEGTYEDDDEITEMPDGGKFAKSDYARLRIQDYPTIEEQLDYIFHNGIEKWKSDMILPIKNKFPKK